MASGMVIPRLSEINFQAGIPASASCRISSADTLPLAAIWPMASVIRSMPSACMPRPAAASPTAVMTGMICSAENPIARSLREPFVTDSRSNGVTCAKSCRSLSIVFACSALPSIVVNAISSCSIFPAALTAPNPMAAVAVAIAAAARVDAVLIPSSESFVLSFCLAALAAASAAPFCALAS